MNKTDSSNKKSGRGKALRIILGSSSAAVLLLVAVLMIRQYVFFPDAYEPPAPAATSAPTPAQAAEPHSASPAPAETAAPEPTASPYARRLPTKMYFTQREISCDVVTVGTVPYTDRNGDPVTDENGQTLYTMGTVDSERVAAWLDASASPGEMGNAIFNGHITWKKVAGVFSILSKLEPGEEIVIGYDDGSTMAFKVESVDIYALDDVPQSVMAYDTGDVRITLITCYGESWNSQLGTRNERCVVVAKPE